MKKSEPVIMYNLFPRLVGSVDQWPGHAERAAKMGFNWIYLNPVTLPGFSGSLYAIKDYYRMCPDFLEKGAKGDGLKKLANCLEEFHSLGLQVAMDLVINHTSIDCPLIEEHPGWYVHDQNGKVAHPSAIDPADARQVTVWGDLAEIDNKNSPERDSLWAYWKELVGFYIELGFDGFRCDAAYKVPTALWKLVSTEAKRGKPRATFFAETLGCRLEEVSALSGSGLDYLYNSSKYWNFDAPWALEQHESFQTIAPSISFAESHDTPRLMTQTEGNLIVQRQRYLFSAIFSAGLMMPIGYEYGFRKPLHVVRTVPGDWEDTGQDISSFIREVNQFKIGNKVFCEEGHWTPISPFDQPTVVLEKSVGKNRMQVLINKDWFQGQEMSTVELPIDGKSRLWRISANGQTQKTSVPAKICLAPAEIVLID